MSEPRVASSRFPYIPIRVEALGHRYELDALVDTGFDGDVAVPAPVAADWGQPDRQLRAMLADGSMRWVPVYRGFAEIDGLGRIAVSVLALGPEVLVGCGIVAPYAVLLDHGQRVVFEP